MKKNFNVEAFKQTVNDCLKHGENSAAFRRGMIALLEHVLYETGNYKGFTYLRSEDVPPGFPPGIYITKGSTFEETPKNLRFSPALTDSTRIRYI